MDMVVIYGDSKKSKPCLCNTSCMTTIVTVKTCGKCQCTFFKEMFAIIIERPRLQSINAERTSLGDSREEDDENLAYFPIWLTPRA